MSAERVGKKVMIFDRHATERRIVKKVLRDNNHEPTGEASTLDEALVRLREVAADERECDVVVFDQNLTLGSIDGSDGRAIIQAIDLLGLKTHRIRIGSTEPENGTGVHADMSKEKIYFLANIIGELPPLEQNQDLK
jgi:hypothetical protein